MFPRRKGLLLRRLMKLQSRKTEKEKTDDDVIISRILMPVREAREYAERETVSGNGVERNYVIESWERLGTTGDCPIVKKRSISRPQHVHVINS